jgi:hypothetical protein
MKRVFFVDGESISARDLIMQMMRHAPPEKGFSFDEMTARLNVQAAIKESGDNEYFDVEDADYTVLQRVMKAGPYVVADAGLQATVKAVLEAKEPPKAPKKS